MPKVTKSVHVRLALELSNLIPEYILCVSNALVNTLES